MLTPHPCKNSGTKLYFDPGNGYKVESPEMVDLTDENRMVIGCRKSATNQGIIELLSILTRYEEVVQNLRMMFLF